MAELPVQPTGVDGGAGKGPVRGYSCKNRSTSQGRFAIALSVGVPLSITISARGLPWNLEVNWDGL